jgi:hypothetical protein
MYRPIGTPACAVTKADQNDLLDLDCPPDGGSRAFGRFSPWVSVALNVTLVAERAGAIVVPAAVPIVPQCYLAATQSSRGG